MVSIISVFLKTFQKYGVRWEKVHYLLQILAWKCIFTLWIFGQALILEVSIKALAQNWAYMNWQYCILKVEPRSVYKPVLRLLFTGLCVISFSALKVFVWTWSWSLWVYDSSWSSIRLFLPEHCIKYKNIRAIR